MNVIVRSSGVCLGFRKGEGFLLCYRILVCSNDEALRYCTLYVSCTCVLHVECFISSYFSH